jgi:hypothetical protein
MRYMNQSQHRLPLQSAAIGIVGAGLANGRIGLGGGLYLDESAGMTLETVGFQLNNASIALTVPDPAVDWNTGFGGCAYFHNSPDLTLLGISGDEEAASLLIGNVAASMSIIRPISASRDGQDAAGRRRPDGDADDDRG